MQVEQSELPSRNEFIIETYLEAYGNDKFPLLIKVIPPEDIKGGDALKAMDELGLFSIGWINGKGMAYLTHSEALEYSQ